MFASSTLATYREITELPKMRFLLSAAFLISLGSYVVTPFLAVYIVHDLGLASATVASALSAKLLIQNAGMLPGGYLADRIGQGRGTSLGVVARSSGYVLLAFSTGPVQVIIGCALIGAAGAIYIPASKDLIARTIEGTDLGPECFGLRSMSNNAGLALGPIVGLGLYAIGPQLGLLIAAACFLSLAMPFWRLDGAESRRRSSSAPQLGARLLPARTYLVWLAALSLLFGYTYSLLEYFVPVFVNRELGPEALAVVFTTNALLVLVTQIVMVKLLRRLPTTVVVLLACVLMSGIALLPKVGPGWLLIAVVLFTVGEVSVDPRVDAEVARRCPSSGRGLVYGTLGCAFAVGGLLGNTATSSLLSGSLTVWYSAFGVISALVVMVTIIQKSRTKYSANATSSPTPGRGSSDHVTA